MNNVVEFKRERKSILDEQYIRAKDLSKIFIGLSPSTFDGWARKGLLSSYKIEGSIFQINMAQNMAQNSPFVIWLQKSNINFCKSFV